MTTIVSTPHSPVRAGTTAIDAAVRPLRSLGRAITLLAVSAQLGGHREAEIGRLTGARI